MCPAIDPTETSASPEAHAPEETANPPALDAAARARLQRVVAEHFQIVWRTLRRLVPEDLVDDAAQQVFLVAARRIGTISPASERPFLLQTAVFVSHSIRRTLARRREVGSDAVDLRSDPNPLPDEAADLDRRKRLLDEVLESMPTELREVFVLFELEGLPSTEIAPLLGIPVGTVASRLRRAREHFHAEARRIRARLTRRGAPP